MLIMAMLLCALAVTGCAKKKAPGASAGAAAGKAIVTPENNVMGRVGTLNLDARFVVLNFPGGKMPAQDQRLTVYRRDVKVAEVKITGPERAGNVVADIVSGEPEVGDEVRVK
jgi:hypothetical protein